MRHLSGVDALFLRLEGDRQAMNLTAVALYEPRPGPEGPVGYGDVLARAADRARDHAVLRRKAVSASFGLDQPVWVEDPAFSVGNHVFRVSLPAPGTREQLDREIARIHALRIDRARPLWEWWFIDGLGAVEGVPAGSFAIAFKHHHAAFDDAAVAASIRIAHDQAGGGDGPVDPPAAEIGSSSPGLLALAGDSIARALGQPARLIGVLRGSAPLLALVARRQVDAIPRSAGKAPDTPFNRALSGRRGHHRCRLNREALRAIGAAQGATLEGVVLAIIGGGMRSYLQRRGLLPAASLIVGVPVALEGDRRRQDSSNNLTLAILPLGTDIADPVARLRAVVDWLAERREYLGRIPIHRMNAYLDFVAGPAVLAANALYRPLTHANLIGLPYNFFVSTFSPAAGALRFAGARLADVELCTPIYDGMAIFHCVTRWSDAVNVTFDFDEMALADPALYALCLTGSQADLLAASGAGSG